MQYLIRVFGIFMAFFATIFSRDVMADGVCDWNGATTHMFTTDQSKIYVKFDARYIYGSNCKKSGSSYTCTVTCNSNGEYSWPVYGSTISGTVFNKSGSVSHEFRTSGGTSYVDGKCPTADATTSYVMIPWYDAQLIENKFHELVAATGLRETYPNGTSVGKFVAPGTGSIMVYKVLTSGYYAHNDMSSANMGIWYDNDTAASTVKNVQVGCPNYEGITKCVRPVNINNSGSLTSISVYTSGDYEYAVAPTWQCCPPNPAEPSLAIWWDEKGHNSTHCMMQNDTTGVDTYGSYQYGTPSTFSTYCFYD